MRLILVENGPQKGRGFPVSAPGPHHCGRDPGAAICLADPMVSRRHFAIETRGPAFFLRDLGSANGTMVNGVRSAERELLPGDRIRAGDTLLTFLDAEAADPLEGKTLKGYRVEKRIGRGGMGTVYLALQVSLERRVALKLLAPEMVEDSGFVERFLEEARSAARLNHPNIVMVYDIDEAVLDGQRVVYYSMEYMAGGSVEDVLNRDGPLPVDRALEIAMDTARGLLYAERVGLVHRDIKPGNLMVHSSGTVKIGDLGIAACAPDGGGMVIQERGVSGSPHYISPEQARGQDLDSRADIYSLGASLFQMLSGRTPFQGSDVRELIAKQFREPPPDLCSLRQGLPPRVAALAARMLEKNRDRRFPNARALIQALEEALAEVRAPAPAPARHWRRLPGRRLLTAAAAALALAALVSGGVLSWSRYRSYLREEALAESRARGRLEEARRFLESGDLERAAQELAGLAASGEAGRVKGLAAEARSLEAQIEESRAVHAKAVREAEAERVLASARATLPDPAQASSPEELEPLLAALAAVERSHGGTAAAVAAREEAGRVRELGRTLALKHDRAQSALRSVLITAGTFLESSPPRYREALARLRAGAPVVAGTPAGKSLEERIQEVAEAMARDARRWAEEAEREAASGRAEEALRTLERLRERVDGEALAALDAARDRILGAGAGEKAGEKDSP